MKKILFLFIASFIIISDCISQNINNDEELVLRYVKYGTITIGGKPLKEGARFKANQKIKWKKDDQSIKVTSIKTGRTYWLSAKPLPKEKPHTLFYYIKLMYSSWKDDNFEQQKSVLSETEYFNHVINDTVAIRSVLPMDEDHYFVLQEYGSKPIPLPYNKEDSLFYIPLGNLNDQKALSEGRFEFHIGYYDKTTRSETPLVEHFKIIK